MIVYHSNFMHCLLYVMCLQNQVLALLKAPVVVKSSADLTFWWESELFLTQFITSSKNQSICIICNMFCFWEVFFLTCGIYLNSKQCTCLRKGYIYTCIYLRRPSCTTACSVCDEQPVVCDGISSSSTGTDCKMWCDSYWYQRLESLLLVLEWFLPRRMQV